MQLPRPKDDFKMTNVFNITDNCRTKSQKVTQMSNCAFRFEIFLGERWPGHTHSEDGRLAYLCPMITYTFHGA